MLSRGERRALWLVCDQRVFAVRRFRPQYARSGSDGQEKAQFVRPLRSGGPGEIDRGNGCRAAQASAGAAASAPTLAPLVGVKVEDS